MNYTLNEIKIELFDKCHELASEYMNRHEEKYFDILNNHKTSNQNEALDEYHTKHGKVMTKIFNELSKGKLS